MIAVVRPLPGETVSVRIERSQVEEVVAYLRSEYGIEATVEVSGWWGSRRRYHFSATHFRGGSRAYLEGLETEPIRPVADRVRPSAMAVRILANARFAVNSAGSNR